jgi:hypothetical protein
VLNPSPVLPSVTPYNFQSYTLAKGVSFAPGAIMHGSTPEQPYYDPTLSPFQKASYPNKDAEGLWYTPIKMQGKKDQLKMEQLSRENRENRKFLFKHDRMENDVYYDSSINPPNL